MFTKSQSIPLPSLEAYEILKSVIDDILRVVYNFVEIFEPQVESVLRLKGTVSSANDLEFMRDLQLNTEKLFKSVIRERPSVTTFGKVCQLQIHLQVMLRYYCEEIGKLESLPGKLVGPTLAKKVTDDFIVKHPSFKKLLNEQKSGKKRLLSASETQLMLDYSESYKKYTVMYDDLLCISRLVVMPFLKDHAKEENHHYIRNGNERGCSLA